MCQNHALQTWFDLKYLTTVLKGDKRKFNSVDGTGTDGGADDDADEDEVRGDDNDGDDDEDEDADDAVF